MVFSFQSISLQAWFKKVPCQNLSLANEIWDSSPSKVKIMRKANLQSSIQMLPYLPLSFIHSLFLSCQLELFTALQRTQRNENEEQRQFSKFFLLLLVLLNFNLTNKTCVEFYSVLRSMCWIFKMNDKVWLYFTSRR